VTSLISRKLHRQSHFNTTVKKLKQAATFLVGNMLAEDEKRQQGEEMILISSATTSTAGGACSTPKSRPAVTTTKKSTTAHGDQKEDNGVKRLLFDFHVDLVQESLNHVRFLRKLHANGTTLQRPTPRSQHRYVNCWLPLVAKFQQEQEQQQLLLIPPSDVAWLWHCHRLAPMHYERYIRGRFGQNVILEANPLFACQDFHDDDEHDQEAVAGNVSQGAILSGRKCGRCSS
jgi:Glycine-rich domain-containing protein-like